MTAIKQTKNTIYRLGLQNKFFQYHMQHQQNVPHVRNLIAYGLRFRDGMLYLDRIIPTSFLFILAKVAIVILLEFRALFPKENDSLINEKSAERDANTARWL